MRRWLYWPFYTVCYLLWLAFGWSVWMLVRLLRLPSCEEYGVEWREEEE
jgi:hypothetical protein